MILPPFLIALQFLTRLPVPSVDNVNDRRVGYSLLYYPLVGLIIGALLAALQWLLIGAPTMLSAALLLASWILITGGLHLDGLADSADAWVGGLGNRERTLAIMKDPCCGPMGVVALVTVLIIKFAALEALVVAGDWLALIVAPLLARTALPALFLTTPYVRANGLGTSLASNMPRHGAISVVSFVLLALALLTGIPGLWMMLASVLVFVTLRVMMQQRIGGTTGDTAGALVEIIETAILVSACLHFVLPG